MKHFAKPALTSLILGVSAAITGCGGSSTNITPEWETYNINEANTGDQLTWTQDLLLDSYGDLVTLGQTITLGANRKTEVMLLKQTSEGQAVWQGVYPVPGDNDRPSEAVSDIDGNIYIAGNTTTTTDGTTESAGFVVKVDRFGQAAWTQTFAKGGSYSLTLKNNRLYVPGHSTRVFDLDGNLQLAIDHGAHRPWRIEAYADGSFIAVSNAFINKYDSIGNLLWSTATTSSELSMSAGIVTDTNGDIYVAHLEGTQKDARVLKLNDQGQIQWNQFVSYSKDDFNVPGVPMLRLTPAGKVLLVTSADGSRQLTELDKGNGNTSWKKLYNDGIATDTYIDAAGNIYISGGSEAHKLDANGNILGRASISGVSSYTSPSVVTDSSIYVALSSQKDSVVQLRTLKYQNQ